MAPLPRRLLAALSALALGAAIPARAEPSLYESLGGRAGVDRISAGLVRRALADPRIVDTFDNTNLERLTGRLADHFCSVSGGPCAPPRRGMRAVHAHLDLKDRHFNALVEVLQAAMDDEGIPFRTQNRLLALLAPMRRDVVTR